MTTHFYVGFSASGSWHDTVPDGAVGVHLAMGEDYSGYDKIALLIPADEYNSRPAGFAFYIEDPDLYERWEV